VKDGVVEIQGEHIEKVMTWLAARPECKAQGWKLKRAGG
jgi:translation initiation factor 1